jgi:hypothetical protein
MPATVDDYAKVQGELAPGADGGKFSLRLMDQYLRYQQFTLYRPLPF